MKYLAKSFTVPASSEKSPADCKHGWCDRRGKCVLCGVTLYVSGMGGSAALARSMGRAMYGTDDDAAIPDGVDWTLQTR